MKAILLTDRHDVEVDIRDVVKSMGNISVSTMDNIGVLLSEEQADQRDIPDMIIIDYKFSSNAVTEIVGQLSRAANTASAKLLVLLPREQPEMLEAAILAGADDVIYEPIIHHEILLRVRNATNFRRALQDNNPPVNYPSGESQSPEKYEKAFVMLLVRACSYRDNGAGGHLVRVGQISQIIAKRLGMSEEYCSRLFFAAQLHDIGKIGIGDDILFKSENLNAMETYQMRTHVKIGLDILANENSKTLEMAKDIVGCHHERWDGKGYPNKISGNAIPLSARIVAIADVYDALIFSRPYKKPWHSQIVEQYIRENSGSQFDPRCAEAFLDDWKSIYLLTMSDLPVKGLTPF